MDYVVRTDVFEGPFDLLLHLIARQRVDIWQVSLSRITEDYLAEIKRMTQLDLGVATEFLVVAATLLELKAARLLPDDTDRDEVEALLSERDLLFVRLLQYQAYKQVALLVGRRLVQQAVWHPRMVGAEEAFDRLEPDLLVAVAPERLARLAAAALSPRPEVRIETAHLAAPKLSIAEAALDLAGRLRGGATVTFRDLVTHDAPAIEVVVWFLATLELYKRGYVDLDQGSTFGPISMRWVGPEGDALADLDDLAEDPAGMVAS